MENQGKPKTKTSSKNKDGEKHQSSLQSSDKKTTMIPFPDAASFVETQYLDTPFGSPNNWKCSQCGAIIHANFYSGDDCPACGASR